MLERLEYIHGALETAEACLLESVGEYGKEEARAWIWAVLTELEALRRDAHKGELDRYDAMRAAGIPVTEEQRIAARWPATMGHLHQPMAVQPGESGLLIEGTMPGKVE